MTRITLTADDTWPLTGSISSAAGPLDITGWSVALVIDYAVPVRIAGSITDPLLGLYEIPFIAGDLVAGEYDAAIEVSNDTGSRITTSRCRLLINAEIVGVTP